MGPLVTAILLSVLLDPAFLLTQDDQGLPTVEAVPSLNMKFDPRRMELSWDCKENTTYVECVMIHRDEGPISLKPKKKECHCAFQDYSLHKGVTLEVKVKTNQKQISEKLVYTNPGAEGTAAQNFSCFIYNVHFMNCTWAKGQAAPDDVQYFLYMRDSKRRRERECPRYVEDMGTHVGCHLEDLSGLTFHSYFLVNGTSRGTGVQFFDSILWLKKIERYSPPSNITVHCNRSHCLIRWEKSRSRQGLSNREFQYQLDIQRQSSPQHGDPQLIEVSGDAENKYNFLSPEPRAKHTVRIRTADARDPQWSHWSQPVEFGSEEPKATFVHVYLLVVLGTLVCALLLGCLFKRFLRKSSFFQPIPRIKDKLNDSPQTNTQIIWEKLTPGAGKADNEDILTVEEVTEAPASG